MTRRGYLLSEECVLQWTRAPLVHMSRGKLGRWRIESGEDLSHLATCFDPRGADIELGLRAGAAEVPRATLSQAPHQSSTATNQPSPAGK